MILPKKDISKQLRCLRMHLTPTTTTHFIDVLKEAERRLKPGAALTAPAKPTRARKSKGDRVNKYLVK